MIDWLGYAFCVCLGFLLGAFYMWRSMGDHR